MLEKEQGVIDNMGLIRHVIKSFGVDPRSSEYDDIFSEGTIGLLNAARTFDETKNVKFSYWACECIKNQISNYFKRNNKHLVCVSLDEPVTENEEGDIMTYREKLALQDSLFEDEFMKKEMFIEIVNIILNCFKGKERLVMLYSLAGSTQDDIGKIISTSQRYVSKLKKKVCSRVREISSRNLHYKEMFSMAIEREKYVISFSTKDIENFNLAFSQFIMDLKSDEGFFDFSIDCNQERCIIKLPADSKSFALIAQIIQHVENFNLEVL